jgi:hypothetical protein
MHPITLERSAKENGEFKRSKLGIWTAVLKLEREVYEYMEQESRSGDFLLLSRSGRGYD